MTASFGFRRRNSISEPTGSHAAPRAVGPLRRFSRLIRDRRGAASVIFAASSIGFLGLVGLATEAGSWYMANRRGQNAADAAAVAGAMTYASGPSSSTVSAGTDAAARNGFTGGVGGATVSINRPPTLGNYTSNNSAVEAIIAQTQTVSFSSIFNISAAQVSNRAVALVKTSGTACVLSLSADLNLSGSLTVNAPNCALASNATDNKAIDVSGSASITAQTLVSSGGCYGCTNGSLVSLTSPFASYATATTDPFAALQTQTWPSFNNGDCDNTNYGVGSGGSTAPYTINPTYGPGGGTNGTNGTGKVFCGNWHFGTNDNVVLVPGTYFFYGNANIQIGGGTVTCPTCTGTGSSGVSIVMLPKGSQEGTLSINGGIVNLTASPTASGPNGTTYANLSGVLYYRVNDNSVGGSTEVSINGNTGTSLTGGFYFPGADGLYNGSGTSSCTVIVGGSISMNGTANLSETGCASVGLTNLPKPQVVVLVE